MLPWQLRFDFRRSALTPQATVPGMIMILTSEHSLSCPIFMNMSIMIGGPEQAKRPPLDACRSTVYLSSIMFRLISSGRDT
jgi:hypothetical protein